MSMSIGRPLQQHPSNVRVVRRNQWSKALSPAKKKKNGDEEKEEEEEKEKIKRPSPILKKVSSFDTIEVSSSDDQHCNGGEGLDYQSPLRKDGLIMDPPTPMFFSFTYGLYSDSTTNSSSNSHDKEEAMAIAKNCTTDEESSSSCSSCVEDPSPPPWKSLAEVAAADESAKKKKKVTFAVPEAVTFAEKEIEAPPPPPLILSSPRGSRAPGSSYSPIRSPRSIHPGWKKQSSPKAGRVAPEGLVDLASAAPDKKRCSWITPQSDPAYVEYHDSEWGVPVHDDKKLFELLVFAGAQAELSWSALLSKREHYRAAFAGFDAEVVSKFDEAKISSLSADPEILQHEGKIRQIVDNAKCIVEVVQEFGSLDKFVWNFLSHKPIVNRYRTPQQVPIKSAKSDLMSRDLMKRGFRFVGPTIMYSFMQAAGMTNDHVLHCFRHQECIAISSPPSPSPSQEHKLPNESSAEKSPQS
ncbi:uncharacterized protein LOC9657468 [Selaginella moellendorffii]|nr:uncharacterized protein LOC9657468 [Selaginella moellendorffii]|eukprot:XP_002988078.2 uncharacterized protein LOC9657468 [Selaginella moellendorffii]